MLNLNFVPEDYIENKESRRTNLICLILFLTVMVCVGVVFASIRVQQRTLADREQAVNEKMGQAKDSIKQFERLRVKFKVMSETAIMTSELLESVPRSVLLASVTNDLPRGVSLLKLNLVQKQPKEKKQDTATSKYQTHQKAQQESKSQEQLLETNIEIEGLAPSDLGVAAFIKNLSDSELLDNVALVESKESKANNMTIRQFKLTAMLKTGIYLTNADVGKIRTGAKVESATF